MNYYVYVHTFQQMFCFVVYNAHVECIQKKGSGTVLECTVI